MNRVVAAYPERQIHVVLDNLSTHKAARDMWLKRHQNVHFHYTPTHASWLSQIEIWFSVLTTQSLNGASFQSVKELVAHIGAFIERYNHTARPFLWTKSKVHQKRLRSKAASFLVPVLVMHSEDDQIVPYADSGPLSAKLLKHGTLKTYKDYPHGMPTTHADVINADLLAFIKS